MYSRLPAFVFGFHGCDQRTKENVLKYGEPLAPSLNEYDWLGGGIYFWEQNPERAMDFAIKASQNPGKFSKSIIVNAEVIGAVIDLGNCLNLMDATHIKALEGAYEFFKEKVEIGGGVMPVNKGHTADFVLRYLDRAVLESLHELKAQIKEALPYDTVRGLYTEGEEIYPGAGFKKETHIQICVRNQNCIKAFFDPRELSDKPFAHLVK